MPNANMCTMNVSLAYKCDNFQKVRFYYVEKDLSYPIFTQHSFEKLKMRVIKRLSALYPLAPIQMKCYLIHTSYEDNNFL